MRSGNLNGKGLQPCRASISLAGSGQFAAARAREPIGRGVTKGMPYEDIKYGTRAGVATITINRPEVHNAFRGQTCEE